MLYNGAVRTVSVFFEPVPRSKSQRSITRDAAKIESDAQQRAEKGFRVGAHHRRAAQAVEEREEELVAGYGEYFYAGVVCVSAASLTELETAPMRSLRLPHRSGLNFGLCTADTTRPSPPCCPSHAVSDPRDDDHASTPETHTARH